MKETIKQLLADMHRNVCVSLSGRTVDRNDLRSAVLTQLKASMDATPEQEERVVKLYQEAWNDPEKMKQLCGMRTIATNNYIMASSVVAAMFFNVVNLANDEQVYYQNTLKNEVQVHYLSQDGHVRTVKVPVDNDEFRLPMRRLTTQEVEYMLEDIERGDISDAAKKTIDLGFDLRTQVDVICMDLLDTSFGNFVTTGRKIKRTYHAHSRVKTLPSTNLLTLSGNSGSTKLRTAMFKAVLAYCDHWGTGAFADGDLRPTGRILVPSVDSTDLLDEFPATGAATTQVAQDVQRNYTRFNYGGVNWELLPVNFLPTGAAYPELSKKPGNAFFKPGMDREYVNTIPKENKETRSQAKPFQAYIAEPDRIKAAKVVYKTVS